MRGRNAQVIRPERDESLDERTLGDDARLERGEGFRPGNLDQPSPRLLARLRWLGWLRLLGRLGLRALSSVRLRGHAKRVNRIADGRWGRYGRSGRYRCVTGELRPKPAARIPQSASLAGARAQTETVQRTERGVHARGYSLLGPNVYQRSIGPLLSVPGLHRIEPGGRQGPI